MPSMMQPLKLAVPQEDHAEFPGFVYLSGRKQRDRDSDGAFGVIAEPVLSFVVIGERVAAEWCPPYGPISLWFKGDDQDHYTFARIRTPRLDWSQRAVDDNDLPGAFIAGNFAHIFATLRGWAESRSNYPSEWESDDEATPAPAVEAR